jgi:hypothetical protein
MTAGATTEVSCMEGANTILRSEKRDYAEYGRVILAKWYAYTIIGISQYLSSESMHRFNSSRADGPFG